MKKTHLHEEQFDGRLHAACARANDERSRIVVSDEFGRLSRAERCSYCTRIEWPHGCDPE